MGDSPPEPDLFGRDDGHYLNFSAPAPTLPFIDVHDYDLPYGGRNFLHDTFAKSHTSPVPFQFKGSGPAKKEGATLLSSLTGVKSDVVRHKHWVPGCGRVRCKYVQDFSPESVNQLEGMLDGKKRRPSKPASSQRSRKSYVCYMVDECVDTGDLDGLVFDFDAESETTGAQGSSSSSSDEDDGPEKKPGVVEKSPDEYFALIKDSMSRIGLRTQMLQDLSLGECPARDAPAASLSRAQGQGAAATTAAQEGESPYMSHSSISVKQARRLIGAMHTDEQAIDLRDLLSWMQHLAGLAEEKSKDYESRQSDTTEQMKSRLQTVGGSDWRLPASPPIALQLANEDLQNRLANLYQEKNFLNNKIQSLKGEDMEEIQDRPQEFMTALRSLEEDYELLGDSVSKNLVDAERLEERYQVLAQQLNATGNSAGKHLHDMEKAKRLLGPDAAKGLQKLPPSRPDSAFSGTEQSTPLSTPESATDDMKRKPRKSRSPEAMREPEQEAKPPIRIQSRVYPKKSPSPKLGKGEDDRRSPSPASGSGSQTPESRSTTRSVIQSETSSQASKNLIQIIQEDKTKIIQTASKLDEARFRRPSRRDKAVQTDAITLSALMDGVHREYAEPISKEAKPVQYPSTPVAAPKPTATTTPETPATWTTPESEASRAVSPALGEESSSKVEMLHSELEKSKKQLNYYRARNWAEKHEAHAVPTPVTSSKRPEEPIAPEGDVGLIFVYNPTSGFHTMLSSVDVGHSKSKGALIRGSTVYHDKPMSAPAAYARSGSPLSVSTSNRVVSASQVMKLIAKRREQQQQAKGKK